MRRNIIFMMLLAIYACSKSGDGEPIDEPTPNPMNSAPTVPLKVSPSNGLLCTEIPLSFEWQSSSDSDGDAISYEIEISKDAQFSDVVINRTVSSTSISVELEKGVEFSWRVRAIDSKNVLSSYSTIWSFLTEAEGTSNYAPFTPTLVSPLLNTKVLGNSVNLEWQSSDVDADELLYDLYFGKSNPPSLITEGISTSNMETEIDLGTTYYWQVRVKDQKGGEAIGQIWTFKT